MEVTGFMWLVRMYMTFVRGNLPVIPTLTLSHPFFRRNFFYVALTGRLYMYEGVTAVLCRGHTFA